MPRYIDADKVEKWSWQEPRYSDSINDRTDLRDFLRSLPTVSPDEVRVVGERLPEVGIDVLVTDGSDVCISHQVRYVSPTERFTFWSRDDLDLTHWMPLPSTEGLNEA